MEAEGWGDAEVVEEVGEYCGVVFWERLLGWGFDGEEDDEWKGREGRGGDADGADLGG